MDLKLCDSEYRFMLLVWETEPVRSGDLVKISHDRLGWKQSTTYTVIKKLAERGFLQNEDTIVSEGKMPGCRVRLFCRTNL